MSKSARILVVDDDPVILRLIEVNLDLEGFEVLIADRGEDAISKARSSAPDLIILDLMMPEMSGWEIAERLQQDDKTNGIPLVFLSARTQDEDRRRGEELGVAGYVTKPFDPADLVSTIRKLTKPD
ncbi:MAG: response regulator transcription factor [Actinomycetota bacterium]